GAQEEDAIRRCAAIAAMTNLDFRSLQNTVPTLATEPVEHTLNAVCPEQTQPNTRHFTGRHICDHHRLPLTVGNRRCQCAAPHFSATCTGQQVLPLLNQCTSYRGIRNGPANRRFRSGRRRAASPAPHADQRGRLSTTRRALPVSVRSTKPAVCTLTCAVTPT